MTYQPDYRDAWAKLDWAREHADVLKQRLNAAHAMELPDSDRVALAAKFDEDDGRWIARVVKLPENYLSHVGLMFGDAIHGLRSALDHVVWQFAVEANGGKEPTRRVPEIAFPMTADSAAKVKKRVTKTRATALSLCKPYEGDQWGDLALLHRLDVRDKHRSLIDFEVQGRDFDHFNIPGGVNAVNLLPGYKNPHLGAHVVALHRKDPNADTDFEVTSYMTPNVFIAGKPPVQLLEQLAATTKRALDTLTATH